MDSKEVLSDVFAKAFRDMLDKIMAVRISFFMLYPLGKYRIESFYPIYYVGIWAFNMYFYIFFITLYNLLSLPYACQSL